MATTKYFLTKYVLTIFLGIAFAANVYAQSYPTPSVIYPVDGATIYSSSQNPCFTWAMSSHPMFSYYTITVSTTLDFPTTRWAYQINSISSSTITLCWNNGAGWGAYGTSPPPAAGPLQNGVTYYWRVLATFTDGTITGKSFAGRSFLHQASPTTAVTSYQYDELGRVKTVTHPNSVKDSYNYDAADNRTQKTVTQ